MIASDAISLEATTSSADEGEAGKVRLLYDLVFDEDVDRNISSGMLIEVNRGSSLDVGLLHGPEHDTRQRCTIEMWYHLPSSIVDEVVLFRRSSSSDDDDLSKVCIASAIEDMIWELVVMPNGKLEFRSNSGSTMASICENNDPNQPRNGKAIQRQDGDDLSNEVSENGLVRWQKEDGYGGWNHICLIFNSRSQMKVTDCSVTLMMKGIVVASSVISFVPPGLDVAQSMEMDDINEAMGRTALMLGLGAPTGFRITEVRVWSCKRSEDDVKMMMYESLRAAEIKKKFKVRIRNRQSPSKHLAAGSGLIAPLKTGKVVRLNEPDKGKKASFAPPAADSKKKINKKDKMDEANESQDVVSPQKDNFVFDASFEFSKEAGTVEEINPSRESVDGAFTNFGTNAFMEHAFTTSDNPHTDAPADKSITFVGLSPTNDASVDLEIQGSITPDDSITSIQSLLFEISPPLSKQVRNSAAAAIIRGPPATRHFGGNRGGLPTPTVRHRRDARR